MSTAKQSSISSPGNTASPPISANLTTPSSSTDKRSADKSSLCPTVDQTFISPSTDQLFAEKTSPPSPSSSADQTSLSASDYKESRLLSANETSSQSSDQSSACRAADKNSTAKRENSSSTVQLDTRSDSSVETIDDMQSCIPGPSSTIPSEPSESHVSQPTPSPNDAMVPNGSQLSQSTTTCDVAPDSVTIAITPTALESGSAAIRPLMSIEVKPPGIPSLMSVKTTPPPFWRNDYAFGPRYRYRHPMPRHSGNPRPHRKTSSTRGGVTQTTAIPALMSIETSPPVAYNSNRNDGNRRGMPAPSGIPSLMSIQTRPPWGNGPPRGGRPSRGTRRPQARG